MIIESFLSPRLTGTRFEGHAIPLEFLKDLAVLEEMIIEVAKAKFLDDHSDRRRSPRGFSEGVQFKLTSIENGSAIPVISLSFPETTLFPPDNQIYFERARDAVVDAIDAAGQNTSITDHLPEKTLSYFDRLGRSLRDGEAIEFDGHARKPAAKLTKETRRRLLLASPKVQELTEETSIRGMVPAADQDNMTFEIQLFDGRKVKAPIATQHLDTVVEAFNRYQVGTRILVQGVGRFNRHERLLGLDSVEHINILDPLDVSARIDELRTLKDGWLEGMGAAPRHDGLNWLSQAFDQHYPDELPYPYLYPTAEGGVRAEWSMNNHEITLDIDLDKHCAYWHDLDMKTDADTENDLKLDKADDWQWIVRELQTRTGGAA